MHPRTFFFLQVGPALDTSFERAAGMGSCMLLLLGTCLPLEWDATGLKPTANPTQLLLFAVVYGLGYGASYAVISAKPAKLFGEMPEFGKLQGFWMLFQVIGGFFGTILTGKLRVATGSFTLPFCIFIAMALMACLHYIALEHGIAAKAGRTPRVWCWPCTQRDVGVDVAGDHPRLQVRKGG